MSNGGKRGDRQSQESQQQQRRPKADRPAAASARPSRMGRLLVSMWLLFHCFVLFLYPMANSRSSDTVRAIARSPLIRWYADPLNLNIGYGFFGPDPGPSILVEYEVFNDAGQSIKEGKFPDPERIWPRLRYHRYKMLADQLEAPGFPEDRRGFVLNKFAHQLIREHDGASAVVTEVEHDLVRHHEWLGDEELGVAGKSLDDKSLYRNLARAQQTRADVELADAKLNPPDDPNRNSETVPRGRTP